MTPAAVPCRPTRAIRLLQALGALLLALLLQAGLAPGRAQAGTLPGELPALVGRLSAVQGDVQWFDRDRGSWLASTPGEPLRNWPVAAGDRLRTGADARAELRIGSSTLRLGAGAELWLQRLDEQAVLLNLQAGSVALHLPATGAEAFGPLELLTREGSWSPLRPGSYRLDRQSDATQATAWLGELRFTGHDSALTITPGRRADLWLNLPGSASAGLTRFAWAAVERDAFADWVAREERGDVAPLSARHVPPGMTGWQDLDRHGDWIEDPELGNLWQPRVVAPGWAPFHDGRWAWVAPWGWTWIDAAPWGFAPFHYGSWLMFQGRWCWSPGPRGGHVRYAPALSAWVGGPSVGIGIHIGGRPPPPRVVVPVVVVRGGPPRVALPPGRPPFGEPREFDRRPGHAAPREPDRRDVDRRHDERPLVDRRDNDRRDNDRRDNDRRDSDQRDNDRRDTGRRDGDGPPRDLRGPAREPQPRQGQSPAPGNAPATPAVHGMPAPPAVAAPAATPTRPGPGASPATPASPAPAAAAAPVATPAVPAAPQAPGRTGSLQRQERGDRGDRSDRGDRVDRGERGNAPTLR